MTSDLRLLMLSAMYENGGNTTQRLLDGHPELFVYPFESQLGTRLVVDALSSLFPVKYRWPVFALDATPEEDYRAIIDEECKVRARTPQVSKFRHVAFDFSDDERGAAYCRHVAASGRTRGDNVAAFFRATFDAWKDYRRTDRQQIYVGYSPIVVVDADKILRDLPAAHVLHVVRNPWSAYADTKKRPVPLSLETYLLGWTLNQYYALLFQRLFPGRMHIVRIEDVMEDPLAALRPICDALGVEVGESLRTPSWNGAALQEVYPWGTIRRATPEANRATAAELTAAEREQVRERARPYLEVLDYASFARR
jgi:sulfotransferase family protein